MKVNGGALCSDMPASGFAPLPGGPLGPPGHADYLGDPGCHEKVPGGAQGTEKRRGGSNCLVYD